MEDRGWRIGEKRDEHKVQDERMMMVAVRG
jgi:hypothetical protein